ncbi:hypothetical protein B0H14DRAFT_3087824 [Mycena olivaceomarginata]|nr:hypothetical protein B0H14DRAFT_3095885 [Mycena olivaceomarginata]KAJ7831789.1 hypothetical protein B0H14DRAFT_3087824 [Mycena olivaceomarginata]
MHLRLAKTGDPLAMQATNLQNLPENYTLKLWMYHLMTWPALSFVAEDSKGRSVGYVLAKMDALKRPDDDSLADGEIHGHMSSISVMRTYRRLGLAKNLMLLSPAISLYRDSLGFSVQKVEPKYYEDDALCMQLALTL